MDEFKPQSPGIQVTVGHEECDFSARGIVIFIGVLVFSGVMTFVIAHYMMIGLESLEKDKVPLRCPLEVGVKLTCIKQLPPCAIGVLQLFT